MKSKPKQVTLPAHFLNIESQNDASQASATKSQRVES
jgi:hypothetical protein